MHLLDVNILIALGWEDHQDHELAHEWFRSSRQAGFATCHSTQSGFLRLSLNPHVVNCQLSAPEALAKLASFTSSPEHRFMEDGPVEADLELWHSVTKYDWVTDRNLLLIARRHGGRLATMDDKLPSNLPSKFLPFVTSVRKLSHP